MSYCALCIFRGDTVAETVEYRNSWGGAAYVWDALFNLYIKDPAIPYDTWLARFGTDRDSLWKLANGDAPEAHRAVLLATFDWALVMRQDFSRFAADLREFVRWFGFVRPAPHPADRHQKIVCHLSAWADEVEGLDADAVGLYATSVGENPWAGEFDEDDEEHEGERAPYSLATGTKHWSVYARLAEINAERAIGSVGAERSPEL